MTLTRPRPRVGDLRPSQLLFTFGVGSIVELPHLSVMVMGLEFWNRVDCEPLSEPRLLAAVKRILGPQVQRLTSPPVPPEGSDPSNPMDEAARMGVPVAAFPRWMRCPRCELLAPLTSSLFVLKTELFRPDRARYVHQACPKSIKPPTVVPARFLVACENGHLDDFPWSAYLHGGETCEGSLRLSERGISGTARDVWLTCDACGKSRNMAPAFETDGTSLFGACRGRRAHLSDTAPDGCGLNLTPILLGASNSWFPILLSALSVPEEEDALGQLLEKYWHRLQKVTSAESVPLLQDFLPELQGHEAQTLWQRIEQRRAAGAGGKSGGDESDLKAPEWSAFSNPDAARNGADFRLRTVPSPSAYASHFERVVLAERLREVHTVLGFTRIESPGDLGGAEEIPPDRRAPLSRKKPQWIPAVEIRGEGLFIQFREERVQAWCGSDEVVRRSLMLSQAHAQWRMMRKLTPPEGGFPGMRYVLLHSFAHALMRQLSLECGYTSASLRERIYARDPEEPGGPMAGVLIYTAAADSEGTLGGLVALGEPEILVRHLDQALEAMTLCGADPLCAEHFPEGSGLTLHGAACHACQFAAETSCERGNKYLDRSTLVETLNGEGAAFFRLTGEAATTESASLAPSRAEKPPHVEAPPMPVAPPPGEAADALTGLPVYDLQRLEWSEPLGWRRLTGSQGRGMPSGAFLVQMKGSGLDQRIAAGSWVVFRRLGQDDPVPARDSIVIVRDPALHDPDLGSTTVRRLLYSEREDPDGKTFYHVALRPSSSDARHNTLSLKVSGTQWPTWRPLASLVRVVLSEVEERPDEAESTSDSGAGAPVEEEE